jgi:uncharacterized Zn finger protein
MKPLDDWFDEKTLLDLLSPQAFVDGAAAAEHGAVEILERDDARLRARVVDGEVRETSFWLEDDQLKWSCTCGAAEAHPCEHLAASAFATWPGETPVDP